MLGPRPTPGGGLPVPTPSRRAIVVLLIVALTAVLLARIAPPAAAAPHLPDGFAEGSSRYSPA